jgi:Zinc finger C-x8-C-x5-C-x3-H type (and similar)
MGGECRFGDRCNFAHGEQELRSLPPRDPYGGGRGGFGAGGGGRGPGGAPGGYGAPMPRGRVRISMARVVCVALLPVPRRGDSVQEKAMVLP